MVDAFNSWFNYQHNIFINSWKKNNKRLFITAVLNELKNHENYSFSVNEKITDNDIYISGSSSIVNKKQKKYKVSVRVDYFVLYRWGYTLTINCSLVDDKVVIEDWGGKYG